MQLQEILSQLETTPIHYNAIMIAAFILAAISFIAMLVSDIDGMKFRISVAALAIFLLAGLFTLTYTQSSRDSAIKEAKINRSGSKIYIESNSEFMKSANLDVIAEKRRLYHRRIREQDISNRRLV